MSFPQYPNPARRARILEAQQLRMQGLTMRQIAQRMHCSVSTVHAYLRDYELFRSDLIQELAADQIVDHLIHFSDPDDPLHDQRRADLHELRLLLSALPQIRRDESDRSAELLQGGVAVDRYGARYPKADRLHPPTPEETQQMQQPTPAPEDPDPDQPLAFIPEPRQDQTGQPPQANPEKQTNARDPFSPPAPRGEMPQAEGGSPQPATSSIPQTSDPTRTVPNKTEQESTPNPAQDATSANSDEKSAPPELQQALNEVERQLQDALRHRDWLNDYPQHNPWHPQRQEALRLVEKRDALLAQTTANTS
ncbi:MAG: hypothetical protein OXH19_06280 [Chloroflexi bacterium]|nr:hypothetical protein [Chloroflexota bacterium]MCY3588983.1 hypothetical protein [Chloroflexota bacterium]MCY3687179.1 hypothetical protein [Chloroflexota bacterium]MDE2707359.1 hypothetical protein [Chloroflexota bacterium]